MDEENLFYADGEALAYINGRLEEAAGILYGSAWNMGFGLFENYERIVENLEWNFNSVCRTLIHFRKERGLDAVLGQKEVDQAVRTAYSVCARNHEMTGRHFRN